MKREVIWLFLVFAVCWVPAYADTISYADSGTFSSAIPISSWTDPNETWAFAFEADRHPTVLEYGNGGFDFAFSNFSYLLNGSPVAITPTFIRLFAGHNGGGFMICFSGTTAANCTDGMVTPFNWPQLYMGPNSAPTMLTGAFTGDLGFAVNSTGYDGGNTTLLA